MRIALLLAALPLVASQARPETPNFVLFLIDDLGWTDLACFGSDFYETPHLDRLAAAGMKFTQAYSACTVCSPTRASLMTGRYPARLHLTDWIPGHRRPKARLKVPDWTMHLPPGEITLAEALQPAGYVSAAIGKWHLGGPEHFPDRQGFSVNLGGCDKGQPPSYFSPYRIPTLRDGPAGEYLTDREADEAVRFLEANRDRPFLLYVPHHAVHNPVQAKKELVEKYQKKKPGRDHQKAAYAAMIESVDESVGRVMAALDRLKLADRTVVLFTSDNGGLLSNTAQKPLRAGKGSAYEGGVRVPLIVRWPSAVKAGSVCETPVVTPDLAATILDLSGARADPGRVLDGLSLAPLLRQSGGLAREAIFWHYPHYHPGGASPYGAVREGDWKLIEFFEDGRAELYHLKEDVGEKNDLAAAQPDRARALRKRLADWRAAVGAQMPSPNPDYDGK
jgi:arylsulfatase A-like enzyme